MKFQREPWHMSEAGESELGDESDKCSDAE